MGLLVLLLVVLCGWPGQGNQVSTSLISERESQLILKRELNEMAINFETNLRRQLTGLESEMYAEFLGIMEGIGTSQGNITRELSSKLSQEKAEVMRKVNNVVTYSSVMVQNLYKQLRGVFMLLGGWTEDMESTLLLHDEGIQLHTPHEPPSTKPDRSKRDMIGWDLDENLEIREPDHSTTLHQPLTDEEPDLDDLLNSFEFLNSFMGTQDPLEASQEGSDATEHRDLASDSTPHLPKDCLDLLLSGSTKDGVYIIYPSGFGVAVWCDMTSEGGGWTVVVGRRSGQPQVNFTRPYVHYQFGFGNPETQHWLGLDHISALTANTRSTLRVLLHDHLQHLLQATYHSFSVRGRDEGYRLRVSGYDPSSSAADALTPHSGATFASPERTHSGEGCVGEVRVGWWFLEAPLCYLALPTGHHLSQEGHRGQRGALDWLGTTQPPLTLLMMVRRVN